MTQPLDFLIRRLIFASIIVFMPSAPGVLILLIMSAISLVFTIFEKPWKDQSAQSLAIFNECSFYLILLFCLSFSVFTEWKYADWFGYLIIGFFTLNIFVNLATIFYESWAFVKLLQVRSKNRKTKLSQAI